MYSINQHISPAEQHVQIASNVCYDMLYDGSKNRIYYTIHGFWKNRECIPDYIPDWTKVLSLVKPGFTILSDMRSMITHPQEVNSVHEQAYKLVISAGVRKVAHVMPTDKIAYLQVQAIQDKTDLPISSFTTSEEADQWLNLTTITPSN